VSEMNQLIGAAIGGSIAVAILGMYLADRTTGRDLSKLGMGLVGLGTVGLLVSVLMLATLGMMA
jgi:hypothetical protein